VTDRPRAKLVPSRLDTRTEALVRVGAMVALDAPSAAYADPVAVALAAGATASDVIGVLIAVAPDVGMARVVSATQGLSLAMGYDIDAAFEHLDDIRGPERS
jgi:alkylhydroperoxidase/carboxymuconolactone decarboxylase family protein YurZ